MQNCQAKILGTKFFRKKKPIKIKKNKERGQEKNIKKEKAKKKESKSNAKTVI